jgi:hypothetical protein
MVSDETLRVFSSRNLKGAGRVAQVVESLPTKHEALSSNPSRERQRDREREERRGEKERKRERERGERERNLREGTAYRGMDSVKKSNRRW